MKKIIFLSFVFCTSINAFAQLESRWFIDKEDGKLGFIDSTGNEIFTDNFESLDEFYNSGLVFFSKNNEHGYLDINGKVAFKSQIAWGSFSEGLLLCQNKNHFYFLDKTGKTVLDLKNLPIEKGKEISAASNFNNGLALVRIHNKGSEMFGYMTGNDTGILEYVNLEPGNWFFGFINKKGQWVIPPKLNSATSFKDGISIVDLGNSKMAFMDKTGKIISTLKYKNVGDYSEGFAIVYNDNGSCFFINKKGERIGNLTFEKANPFSEGLAAVKINDKWGFIDKTGKLVIQPQYFLVTDFSEGLASGSIEVKEKDNHEKHLFQQAIFDKTGKIIIPYQKSVDYGNFKNGLLKGRRFIDNEKGYTGKYELYYINKAGKKIWNEVVDQ